MYQLQIRQRVKLKRDHGDTQQKRLKHKVPRTTEYILGKLQEKILQEI